MREALDVFALQVGTNSLLKETTAASESLTVAPEAGVQCVDGEDNDGDGVADEADPGCHTDGDATNAASFDPTDNDETNVVLAAAAARATPPTMAATTAATRSAPTAVTTTATASSTRTIRAATKATTSTTRTTRTMTPRAATAAGGGAGDGSGDLDDGALPFTGTDVIGIALAGLLVLAGGLLLRRREDALTVR